MSGVVLDIELTDINVIKELGVFYGKVQGYSFSPPKDPQRKHFGVQETLGVVWNTGLLDYSELSHILPRAVKGEYVAKKEKCKILGNLCDKELENLEDHSFPKVQDLVDDEMWICSSYPLKQKTRLHCAEFKAKLFGYWIMRYLML